MSVELELIDKEDGGEIVRNQIAALLVTEIAKQKVLAAAAAKDATQWDFRVFIERTNPWGMFEAAKDKSLVVPIVSVKRRREVYDQKASDAVRRQQADGLFEIDCYGYATTTDDGPGHDPADFRAKMEADRVARLVRNILMSAQLTYLKLRGLVGQRWLRESEFLDAEDLDSPTVQKVAVARLPLMVKFSEFSPQVEGVDLEEVLVKFIHDTVTGEILVAAEFNYPLP